VIIDIAKVVTQTSTVESEEPTNRIVSYKEELWLNAFFKN
jgi:hypothetical protein